MKGSVGTTSIGRSGSMTGARASGATLGVKSLGASISSPEARFSSGTPTFSSRGLSMFNREAISKPSRSIVNPNFGKESKSSFARTKGLAPRPSLFDTSRIVRSNPISRPSEFSVRLNIKNGSERASKIARSVNLAPKSIFDIKRPVHTFQAENRVSKPAQRTFEYGKRITPARAEQVRMPRFGEKPFGRIDIVKRTPDAHQTVARRTLEVGLNPKVRAERVKSISPFKDTIILWQRKDASPRIKREMLPRSTPLVEKDTQKVVEQIIKPSLNKETTPIQKQQREAVYKVFKARQEAKIKLKKERVRKLKRQRVGNMVRVLPETQPDTQKLIYANIREAQKVAVPAIMKARQVSYETALQEAVQVLAKKHEGKVKISTLPLQKTESKPALESSIQNAPVIQTHGKPEQSKKSQPNILNNQNAKGKALEFYFHQDKTANKNRVQVVLSTAAKLLRDKKEQHKEIIGKDVAKLIKDEGRLRSEVVRKGSIDGTLDNFRNEVAKIGKVDKLRNLQAVVTNIAEKFTGVKLSLKRAQNNSATKKDAQSVYKAALNGKEGYFQEYGATTGDFVENDQKLHFVPNSILRSAAVV